jgi:hypothetical protein
MDRFKIVCKVDAVVVGAIGVLSGTTPSALRILGTPPTHLLDVMDLV